MRFQAEDALIVVDVQNDFCTGGALAVAGGEEVVPIANRLMRAAPRVIFTQDWHPADHRSFASNHPGRRPLETMEAPYGPQVLWPDHCVQGSSGAEFHPDLDPSQASLVLRKGRDPKIDSYSAFFENDRVTTTGLRGFLWDLGVHRVFLVGLALDYCVLYSALDAKRSGFEAVIVEEGCRAIDHDGSLAAADAALSKAAVERVSVADLELAVASSDR